MRGFPETPPALMSSALARASALAGSPRRAACAGDLVVLIDTKAEAGAGSNGAGRNGAAAGADGNPGAAAPEPAAAVVS